MSSTESMIAQKRAEMAALKEELAALKAQVPDNGWSCCGILNASVNTECMGCGATKKEVMAWAKVAAKAAAKAEAKMAAKAAKMAAKEAAKAEAMAAKEAAKEAAKAEAMAAAEAAKLAAAEAMPPVSEFHDQVLNLAGLRCVGRRINGEGDRRFSPMVFHAKQCANDAVVATGGLCTTCFRHWSLAAQDQDADGTWHGRVDESLNVMPSTSHIAGGRWWEKRIEEGTLRFTPEAPRLKTARQEGCLERRPAVPDAAQMAFVAGRTELNIEELSARNQLRKCDLLWMIAEIGFPEEVVRTWQARSRPWLCSKIRAKMAGMV
jgi:predicted Fe-S protein YdhL (DUF1289 family)